MVPAMLPPSLPIPNPLYANEVGTFAEDSVVRRLPEIARRTIAENQLDPHRMDLMEVLIDEIGTGTLGRVDEPEAADGAAWRRYVDPYLGSTWRDAPWFFVETYFYRRVLAATGYSQPGERHGIDPFAEQKALALEDSLELAARLGETLAEPLALLGASLWSNQVDLSLWPAGEAASETRTRAVLAVGRDAQLLVNDRDSVLDQLERARSVHFVLDNAGAELVADLALAAAVLARGARVTLHAKPHPTFVSDTTLPDLNATIDRLAATDSAAQHLVEILAAARSRRALKFTAHPFWVSPLPFWQCPPDLVSELRAADLIIVKGDANYRRLLGDRHWEETTPFSSIVRPPAPLVALRTSKAEVMAGVSQEAIDHARTVDPEWLVNGQWGLIQYAPAAS
jgi:uncharacterized protein with ATP-grasp and redox domains